MSAERLVFRVGLVMWIVCAILALATGVTALFVASAAGFVMVALAEFA